MVVIRSSLGRLSAAIGLGIAVEAVLFVGVVVISSPLRDPWAERMFAVTQEPAYHLVDWLAQLHHPGFEEQAAFFLLIPVVQCVVWSALCYYVLSRRVRAETLKSP